MIKVEQTILTPPLGNCYAACLASIFEVALFAVPQVNHEEGLSSLGWNDSYMPRVNAWLGKVYGLWIQPNIKYPEEYKPPGYSIKSVWSPRFPGALHAVVALDGEVVWDPHPQREEGLGAVECWDLICVLDPMTLKGTATYWPHLSERSFDELYRSTFQDTEDSPCPCSCHIASQTLVLIDDQPCTMCGHIKVPRR